MSVHPLTIYCARPMSGVPFAEIFAYYDDIVVRLESLGYRVLTPVIGQGSMRRYGSDSPFGGENALRTTHALFRRDRWFVQQWDVLYVNLLGAKRVSIGCCFELAWACDNGKHVVVVMENGAATENGEVTRDAEPHLHWHGFVHQAADIVLHEQTEAIHYLRDLVEGHT